ERRLVDPLVVPLHAVVDGQADLGHRRAALQILHVDVAGEVPHQDHAVEAGHDCIPSGCAPARHYNVNKCSLKAVSLSEPISRRKLPRAPPLLAACCRATEPYSSAATGSASVSAPSAAAAGRAAVSAGRSIDLAPRACDTRASTSRGSTFTVRLRRIDS